MIFVKDSKEELNISLYKYHGKTETGGFNCPKIVSYVHALWCGEPIPIEKIGEIEIAIAKILNPELKPK